MCFQLLGGPLSGVKTGEGGPFKMGLGMCQRVQGGTKKGKDAPRLKKDPHLGSGTRVSTS